MYDKTTKELLGRIHNKELVVGRRACDLLAEQTAQTDERLPLASLKRCERETLLDPDVEPSGNPGGQHRLINTEKAVLTRHTKKISVAVSGISVSIDVVTS